MDKPRKRKLLLYVLFVIFCVVALKPGLLILDGLAYFSYLPSLFLDHDLNFWNEFTFGGAIKPQGQNVRGITPAGYVSNHWSIGPALLWSPFWLIGHWMTLILPGWPVNGFSIYYNLAVRFATALMGLLTLLFSVRWAARYSSNRDAIFSATFVAFGTPFYWYTFLNADMSHIPGAFMIAMFLTVWEDTRTNPNSKSKYFLLGLLGGLAALVRIQDLVVFLYPLAGFIFDLRAGAIRMKVVVQRCGMIASAALPVMALQIWIWNILFGDPRGPLKSFETYYFVFSGKVRFLEVLFSSYHGIFFFTPLLLLCMIGLLFLWRKPAGAAALLILAIQIVLMSNERWFWEGVSFGMRRLVDWTPHFILGLAVLFHKTPRRWLKSAAGAATVWTLLLLWVYSSRPMSTLFDYQPADQILSWLFELIGQFPQSLLKHFHAAAPWNVLIPALLILGVAGYAVFACMWRVLENRNWKVPAISMILMILLMYGLVARAAINSDATRARYSKELRWLSANTEPALKNGFAEHIFSEAKFEALNQGWNDAVPLFRQSLLLSRQPEALRLRIFNFVRSYMSEEQAKQYVAAIQGD